MSANDKDIHESGKITSEEDLDLLQEEEEDDDNEFDFGNLDDIDLENLGLDDFDFDAEIRKHGKSSKETYEMFTSPDGGPPPEGWTEEKAEEAKKRVVENWNERRKYPVSMSSKDMADFLTEECGFYFMHPFVQKVLAETDRMPDENIVYRAFEEGRMVFEKYGLSGFKDSELCLFDRIDRFEDRCCSLLFLWFEYDRLRELKIDDPGPPVWTEANQETWDWMIKNEELLEEDRYLQQFIRQGFDASEYYKEKEGKRYFFNTFNPDPNGKIMLLKDQDGKESSTMSANDAPQQDSNQTSEITQEEFLEGMEDDLSSKKSESDEVDSSDEEVEVEKKEPKKEPREKTNNQNSQGYSSPLVTDIFGLGRRASAKEQVASMQAMQVSESNNQELKPERMAKNRASEILNAAGQAKRDSDLLASRLNRSGTPATDSEMNSTMTSLEDNLQTLRNRLSNAESSLNDIDYSAKDRATINDAMQSAEKTIGEIEKDNESLSEKSKEAIEAIIKLIKSLFKSKDSDDSSLGM